MRVQSGTVTLAAASVLAHRRSSTAHFCCLMRDQHAAALLWHVTSKRWTPRSDVDVLKSLGRSFPRLLLLSAAAEQLTSAYKIGRSCSTAFGWP
jgi:hypothetical protein